MPGRTGLLAGQPLYPAGLSIAGAGKPEPGRCPDPRLAGTARASGGGDPDRADLSHRFCHSIVHHGPAADHPGRPGTDGGCPERSAADQRDTAQLQRFVHHLHPGRGLPARPVVGFP